MGRAQSSAENRTWSLLGEDEETEVQIPQTGYSKAILKSLFS